MHLVVLLPLAFLVAVIIKQLIASISSSKKAPYPPGPKPKFLLGNIFDFPGSDAAQVYMDWEKKYGSGILHVSALGNHIFVLNKREDAEELFEKRGAKYSDRPSAPVIPLMGWEWNFALLPYGNDWRAHRKLCQQTFSVDAAPFYSPILTTKVREMLQALLDSPEKYEEHVKMFSVSIPMATMYGYDVESVDDPCISAADRSVTLGAQLLVPGGSIINIFPFMRYIPAWFPGASSHKMISEVKRLSEEMVRIPTDIIKRRMLEGTAPPSLVSSFLEKKETVETSEYEEFVVKNMAYTVYSAAADTTISTVGTMLYALSLHPDIQKKAQEEIDNIVGSSRMPNFEDRKSLPYVEAIYREIMRWRPPLPVGVPHKSSEDDIYKGYFIPKGSTIYSNIWAMTRDETTYPEPETFRPERFLNEDGQLNHDDHLLAYGFGRRICVGKHVASSTVWLALVSILATLDIHKAKDQSGNEIEINDEYVDYGLIKHKKHFACSIRPRSAQSIRLIADKPDC